MRYALYVSERYDDDDDDQPSSLHRVAGLPVGVRTEDWPRHAGRPMQHAFTVDLAELELDVPAAANARALAVFVDSYYELDVDSSVGITVLWLSQDQIDAVPESTPPADFVAELRPGHEQMDEDGEWYPAGEPELQVEDGDEDDEGGNFGDSYVGGQPAWADAGEPAQRPAGAFVLQAMSYEFPLCRQNACLFVFEHGAYLQAEYPDDDERPPSWPEAIAASRELVVHDQPPAADALQKWGGLPRGVSSYDWPHACSHILTWIPEPKPDDMDCVALALFGRLSKTSNWDDELTFYQVIEIRQSDLDEWNADELEIPEGVELLPERAIEFRPLPADTSWRDLQSRCFMGPRPAWRAPDRRSARSSGRDTVLQLTDALLPVAPGAGTLHALVSGGYPIWHAQPGAPQASEARYEPSGTLYASDTSAAIVVGWQLAFSEFAVLPERVEALEKTLLGAAATRDVELTLYVPGDTTTDRNGEVHGSFVFGRAVIVTEANDYEAGAIDAKRVAAALAELPALDDSFWREALAFVGDMQAVEGPAAYLLSWGPLCYGSIYAGVEAEREGPHVYKFVANQDMRQEWSEHGVDGVLVDSVEFSSVTQIELDAAKLDAASKLDGAGFWLICRYD